MTAPTSTMRRGRVPLAVRARRGAAGFLFFVLVGIPLLFFSAALSVDTTLHIMAANQVSSVAEAAAQAASFQQRHDRNTLDAGRARSAASGVYRTSRDLGVMGLARKTQLESTRVRQQQVTVELSYQLAGRNFIRYLLPGVRTSERFTVTRSAVVCTPGGGGPSGGHCAAPRPS